MAREDWRGEHYARDRRWRTDPRDRDDFGQADYSTDYAYDARSRSGYRADEDLQARDEGYGRADYTADWAYDPERRRPYRRDERDYDGRYGEPRESRSWMDRTADFFVGRRDEADRRERRRRGPSDRVLWAVIMERLEDQRGLDLRDVDVIVEDAEVILNGTVRRKDDKRRIEDIADIDGVRNVQNNLRLRERDRGWTFL